MLLKLLDVDFFIRSNALIPVTVSDIYTKDDNFDDHGLFSNVIFGKDRDIRIKRFSYINLNCTVIHPTIFEILNRIDRRLIDLAMTTDAYSVDENGNLFSDPDAESGIEAFKSLFSKIKFRGGTSERDALIKLLIQSYKSNTLFIDKIIVIPPEFRPVYKDADTGEEIRDTINDFYIKILRHAATMKSASGGGVFFNILGANMQKNVNDLDSFIKMKLGKKYGLIRNQLLGKRVDFSGRAVIINGPTLRSNEVGIPIRIAVNIFEPFIIHNILLQKGDGDKGSLHKHITEFTKQELSIDSIKKVLKAISDEDEVPPDLFEQLFSIVQKSMEHRVVLLKRDPALRPESVRSFNPILIRGSAIAISNLVTSGFNADFDGDMMAVIHPMSNEAQQEARKMMRAQSSDNMSSMAIKLAKDTVVGIYILTKDYPITKKPIEFTHVMIDKENDPSIPVIFQNKVTTMGKIIFNSCFPKGFRFIETPIKSSDLDKLLDEIYRTYPPEEVSLTAYKLMIYAYKFVTIAAPSMTIDNFIMPAGILKDRDKLGSLSMDENIKLLDKLQDAMKLHLKGSSLYDLIESGGSKGWGQPFQIFVSKGFVTDVKGNLLPPIKGSYAEGLTPKEHFDASYGSRKGIVDRVISTSDTGYTSRQLVYLLNGVELDPHNEDCKTKRTLQLRLNKSLMGRLEGRYIVENNNLIEFKRENFKDGDVINLRSPIYCTAKNNKICLTCYGKKMAERVKTPYIGVLAAQLVGEEGTQSTMKNFHCFHKHMTILTNRGLITFESLWDTIKSGTTTIDGCEEKDIDNIVIWDKNKWTKIIKIKRHKKAPGSTVMFMGTRGGKFIISQDNHPHMLQNLALEDKNKFTEMILPKYSYYDYKVFVDYGCAQSYVLDREKAICRILEGGKIIFNRNCVHFNSNSLIRIQMLSILFGEEINHSVHPVLNKDEYIVSFVPTTSTKELFKNCSQLKSFRNVPDDVKFLNNIGTINVYTPIKFSETEFLYDLTTESSTFTVNGIWEHNSGGAVKLENKNIIKDIIENMSV